MLAAAFALIFAILALSFPAADWRDIETYARTFRSVQMASFIPAILLAIATAPSSSSPHWACGVCIIRFP